ncbi:MAG TPA: 3-oxoacyl-[acyl-carrier-protein] synthase III C-terminal domain-containing protein [Candidatus Acidoferrum sp.]|nr:3-oxoacyl-[acyl-carrier-protein] synthase III C-terminal domain-containing protein [Candidatus Acidoferrum sp.]
MRSVTEFQSVEIRSTDENPTVSSRLSLESPIVIAGSATAVPPHILGREEVAIYLKRLFDLSEGRTAMMLDVIENTMIEQRRSVFPIDYLIEPRPLSQVTREFQDRAIALARRAAEECLCRAGLEPVDIDLLITVSCTGVLLPSVGAHLVNQMGFRPDVRRLPITELGCAGGAAALGRAWDYLRGVKEGNVLVVAVELPTLTFQRRDVSTANLISAMLFGDGAAAVALTRRANSEEAANCGAPEAAGSLRIVDVGSHIFPNSLDALGFDLKETGFHIVLSKDMPLLIQQEIAGLVDELIAPHGLQRDDLTAYILHPGGQKLLTYIEEELSLSRTQTQPSWDVLKKFGNQSSASVLFVLHEWITRARMPAGDFGFLAAFGPGFSTDMVLLQWT